MRDAGRLARSWPSQVFHQATAGATLTSVMASFILLPDRLSVVPDIS
jgi:hypothetical protein